MGGEGGSGEEVEYKLVYHVIELLNYFFRFTLLEWGPKAYILWLCWQVRMTPTQHTQPISTHSVSAHIAHTAHQHTACVNYIHTLWLLLGVSKRFWACSDCSDINFSYNHYQREIFIHLQVTTMAITEWIYLHQGTASRSLLFPLIIEILSLITQKYLAETRNKMKKISWKTHNPLKRYENRYLSMIVWAMGWLIRRKGPIDKSTKVRAVSCLISWMRTKSHG